MDGWWSRNRGRAGVAGRAESGSCRIVGFGGRQERRMPGALVSVFDGGEQLIDMTEPIVERACVIGAHIPPHRSWQEHRALRVGCCAVNEPGLSSALNKVPFTLPDRRDIRKWVSGGQCEATIALQDSLPSVWVGPTDTGSWRLRETGRRCLRYSGHQYFDPPLHVYEVSVNGLNAHFRPVSAIPTPPTLAS